MIFLQTVDQLTVINNCSMTTSLGATIQSDQTDWCIYDGLSGKGERSSYLFNLSDLMDHGKYIHQTSKFYLNRDIEINCICQSVSPLQHLYCITRLLELEVNHNQRALNQKPPELAEGVCQIHIHVFKLRIFSVLHTTKTDRHLVFLLPIGCSWNIMRTIIQLPKMETYVQ